MTINSLEQKIKFAELSQNQASTSQLSQSPLGSPQTSQQDSLDSNEPNVRLRHKSGSGL